MNNMEKLYQKVSADASLQQKFSEIMKDSESAGKEAIDAKLLDFAREAGFEITVEEMNRFFAGKIQGTKDELSDAELDAVAGGKTDSGFATAVMSVLTVGVYCAVASPTHALFNAVDSSFTSCQDMFK